LSRKNVSLSLPIEARAQELIRARGFQGMSDLLATLIREEYERRQPPELDPAQQEALRRAKSTSNISYLKSKQQKKKLPQ
jgi:hypothetical protein